MPTPTRITPVRDTLCLEITWPEEKVQVPFRHIREQCPCAQCVHEITGERLLDPATLPADIHIVDMQLVGNYALKIRWSDGHDTGLFTWESLAKLSLADTD
ncbi:MAG: DUF971 domain-containing protein [Planctomycetota bacterium]|nr:DUF971 domain-containing protein [Planctomycetota bacterium]